MNATEEKRLQRPPMTLVVVREELSFVSRHIDRRRTLALAGLTRQAERQGFINRLIGEALRQQISTQTLIEETGTSAR
jgi:hypothetical protein